ncbi:MAG TPA: hypothetical protein VF756_32330 [Thermoanaerobaculia bacterium]
MAKLLSGGLEHDEVVNRVVPHFLERCPVCQETYREILRLQEEVGHWSEEVAVLESMQVSELWAKLAELPFEAKLRQVDEDEGFHTWGFCQLLLRKSLEAGFENPETAVDLANLAVKVAFHLGDAYDPNWVLDLRARAFAYQGNARRVLGELRSAEDAFRKAERCLARSTSGNEKIETEVLNLKCSLRYAQRRFDEALRLVNQVLSFHREAGDAHSVGKALLQKAQILSETGDLEGAIDLLRKSSAEITEREPSLFAYFRYNLLGCLTLAGRHEEAEQLLPEVRDLFQALDQPLNFVRLRWAEGNIARGLGRLGDAANGFREVQNEFTSRGMAYDAGLVSLDLALLYLQEGRTSELKQLARELVTLFESRDVHREALSAVYLFQRACEEERLTVDLVSYLSELLRRRRPGNGA